MAMEFEKNAILLDPRRDELIIENIRELRQIRIGIAINQKKEIETTFENIQQFKNSPEDSMNIGDVASELDKKISQQKHRLLDKENIVFEDEIHLLEELGKEAQN